MKLKKLLLLISIVIATSSFSSCDPEDRDPTNKCTWVVENTTDSEVIVYSDLGKYIREQRLLPGEFIEYDRSEITKYSSVYFELMFECYAVDNIIITVKTSDGETVLKTWKESERNNPGHQFFSEKFWTKEESQDGRYRIHVWTFRLLPEDLVTPENLLPPKDSKNKN